MSTGRYLKNYQLNTPGFVLPGGSSNERPDNPFGGSIRFNSDTAAVEYFNGTSFITVANVGDITYTVDSFTGDGSTTVFTMSVQESTTSQIMVFVGSIYQDPTTAYTLSGNFDITFTSAPPDGEPISVIHSEHS